MPPLGSIEQLANPKNHLQDAFREAYGGTGRRRASFIPHHTRYYLALASELAARPDAFALSLPCFCYQLLAAM